MKKILIFLAALAAFSAAASAQKFDYNDIEIRAEATLRIAFPMHFGLSALTGANLKGDWAGYSSMDPVNTIVGQNFQYCLELAGLHIETKGSPWEACLGLRWTFMDFSLNNKYITYRESGSIYAPVLISSETSMYDGRKSKIHASYIGVPLRFAFNAGKGKVFVGAEADYLVNGYAKYKKPVTRVATYNLFNRFRASLEAGFAYGALGLYVSYGITPLFQPELSDARTLSFGVVLGI